MYGYLNFKIDSDQGLTATVPNWAYMTDKITPEEWEKRKKARSAILRAECASDPDPDLVARVIADLDNILVTGSNMPAEFAVYMCLAHHRLPEVRRAQRTDTIERIVDAHLGDIQPSHEALSNSLASFKSRARLIPDALLEDGVRTFCFEMAFSVSLEKAPPDRYVQTAFKADLQNRFKDIQANQVPSVIDDLSKFMLSRPADLRSAFQQKVIDLLDQKKGTALVAAFVRLSLWPKDFPLLPIHRFDFYESAIDHLLTVGSADWSLISGDFTNALQAQIKAQAAVVVWNSAAAVLEGVAMGPYTGSSMEALQKKIQTSLGIRNSFTLKRIQNARTLAAVDEQKLSEQEALELRTVQAMSTDQLTRWIEGPIAEDRATRTPIDRKAITQREQERQKKDSKGKPVSTKAPSPETLDTQAGFEGTVCNTLSANAGIWEYEIDRLIGLSKSIKVANELAGESITKCSSMREELKRLAQKPEAFEVENARDLLLSAEQAVRALRKDLGKASAVGKVHDRFAGKLSEALDKEPKVLGKGNGGTIDCPLGFDDWNYVVDNFHRRWLPNIQSMIVDGKRMPLDNDQAAALYVTASSRSGYAFDVSVHLWRRRRGCTGLPGITRALYAPMNLEEWFDTYDTFCVLHIPLKS